MSLQFIEEEGISEALNQLRASDSALNWVLLGYKDKQSIEMLNAGEGGLDELAEELADDQIRFAVLEVQVTGDEYNPIKFVLITWIGTKVPPGLAKARAAGHRQEVLNFVQQSVAIAAEVQPSTRDQLNSKDISGKITRVASTYQDSISVGKSKEDRQELSRSDMSVKAVKLSQLTLIDEEGISAALKAVYKEQFEWAVLTYQQGTKDKVVLKATGKGGLDGLKQELEDDQVCFCCFSMQVEETTSVVTKFLLIAWVGNSVKPLQKARSGPHRSELKDYMIKIVPFHSHFQATSLDELTVENLLFKIRS